MKTWTEKADDLLRVMEKFQQSVTDKKTIIELGLNRELYEAVSNLCQQLKEGDADGGQFIPGSSIMGHWG